ncbi:MAG: c-type cytochrome [Acidobacteriia bacterium]|nr:c-type cytochrome [Terriglobia bacterium]
MPQPSKINFPRAILTILAIAISVSLAGLGAGLVRAQNAPSQPSAASAKVMHTDDLQRSYRLDHYKLLADSGASRGENIYFFKCWMCHNKYAKTGPALKSLYKHDTMMSGDPVNDESVIAKIKEGGPGMPSFKTTLSETDMKDLATYIREGKCCVEGEDPPANPLYTAETNKWPVQSGLRGGATGTVRVTSGDSPEGIGVQLVAPNGVRTTVYTNDAGHFEFPKMQAGNYILRIPTPREFQPYRVDNVHIDGAAKLDDIVLERVSASDGLPSTPEIESQLSGAELLWNVPGTGQEKSLFQKNCSACHSWQQVFRNRYDERSWALIVDRMTHYSGTSLVIRIKGTTTTGGGNGSVSRQDGTTDEEANILTKWLARVRGPEAKDEPLRFFPRPRGEATKVVVTEYQLPQELLALHDAQGDSKGNIWWSSHKTDVVGQLDPKTGIVKEYSIPLTPGAMPGTHAVRLDKHDIPWFSENWGHNLNRLDPQTGKVIQVKIEDTVPLNAPGFGNFSMTDDGFVWDSRDYNLRKIDPETGKVVQRWPLQVGFSYDNLISRDGKYYGGGGLPAWGNTAERMDLKTGEWIKSNTGTHMATAKRGGFDIYNNPWFGGGDGALVELNSKTGRIDEFYPPTPPSPLTDFYEAMPDDNGEVWAGVLHGRQMVRLDPKSGRWIVYELPEPFAYDRRTYIDASTKPVTVWYVDYNGYLVRVQPLD